VSTCTRLQPSELLFESSGATKSDGLQAQCRLKFVDHDDLKMI